MEAVLLIMPVHLLETVFRVPNTLKCNPHGLPIFTRHLKHFYFSFY